MAGIDDIVEKATAVVSVASDLRDAVTPVMDRENFAYKNLPSSQIEALKTGTVNKLNVTLGGAPATKVMESFTNALSDERDTKTIASNLADAAVGVVGNTLIRRVTNHLARQVTQSLEKSAQGMLTMPGDHNATHMLAMENAARLANPAIGLSGCTDLGQTLKSMGVTGQACGGAGFDTKNGLPSGKPSAGIVISARW